MTEILVDVNYGHPPERVWQALTDRRLLSEWFMPTDLEPHEGRAFRLFPEDLPGLTGPIEGELIELTASRRMVMLWRGTHMHCRVVWELEPIGDGCRLKIAQTGFLGVKGSLRRKELQQTYDELLTRRLPGLLDRVAAGGELLPAGPTPLPPLPREAAPPESDTVSPLDGPSAYDDASPTQSRGEREGAGSSGRAEGEREGAGRRWLAWPPRLSHQRRGQLLAVAGAALLAILTLAVISSLGGRSLLPPVGAAPDGWVPDPATTGPGSGGVPPPLPASQSPAAAGAGPTATAGPGVSGSPIAPPPGAPVPPPSGAAPLPPPPPPPEPGPGRVVRADYQTVKAPGSGYHGQIRVENIGTITVSGWVVTVTIQDGARLLEVEGASSSQDGTVVSFAPKGGAGPLDPGDSVVFAFKVKAPGSTSPVACVIDQRSCA